MKKRIFGMVVVLIMVVALIGGAVGCRGPAEAPGGEPIVLGHPGAIGFPYGLQNLRATTFAVEEINAAGGVNVGGVMRPFKLEVLDTRDLAADVPISETLLGVEKLILEKNVDFIVGGPTRSEAALAAMALSTQYKMIDIITTPASVEFRKRMGEEPDKYPYFFMGDNDAGGLVKAFIALNTMLMENYGYDKMFILVQDTAWARGGGELSKKLFPTLGWDVVGYEMVPIGCSDYSIPLGKCKDSGAQSLLCWLSIPESAIMLKQLKSMEVPALPNGQIGVAEHQAFWDETDGACEYVVCSVLTAGNALCRSTPLSDPWVKTYVTWRDGYTERWGEEPDGHPNATAWAAVYALKHAIEAAGTLDSDAVAAALLQVDFMGVGGRVRYDPSNHGVIYADDPHEGMVTCLLQWQDGKRIAIHAPSIAAGELKLPPWME